MATADQIKSLIRSHFATDKEHFYTVALQVAAHEAKQGHSELAHDIRAIVDTERKKKSPKILAFPQDLSGLVATESPQVMQSALVMPQALKDRLESILLEYKQQSRLKAHGMQHRRKILLIGPPGTGKTMTAKMLAHELNLPLHTIQVDRLITKFMGETSAKLRQIFDLIQSEHGVYLFDEFDAIGAKRTLDNDVGEIRRVLNAFLQFIEQDSSDSLIIAATNHPSLLDHALFRRFEDVLYYHLPEAHERKHLIANVLGTFLPERFSWKAVLAESETLSQAEITQACHDAIKKSILSNQAKVQARDLCLSLKARQSTNQILHS